MVRRHRPDLGDGQDAYGTTIRQRALTSDRRAGEWTPQTGRNRLYSMIEHAARLGAVAPARLGRAADLFRAEGRGARRPGFPAARRGRERPHLAAFEAEGADAWYKPGAKARFLGNDYDPEDYEQVFDILDVWFDSAAPPMPSCCATATTGPRRLADLYLEGTDQHRGWFHSSMLQACGTIGRAPYAAC
jgi:isoleucyl-tRNA synthetase